MEKSPEQQLPRTWIAPFFTIWTGQAFSMLGSRLAQFALVWWLTKETGSAVVLTSATMVALLPGVFLGPFVGALVDRWSRRYIMIVADGLIALAAMWLVYLFWSGTMQVWHVYVIVLIRAIGEAFHWPAMAASTSLMVPRQHLSRVQGLNQTLQGLLSIAAPPLGALLYELLPLHGIMAIDVLTALLAILPLLFVAIPQPRRAEGAPGEGLPSLWADVRAGLRYIWGWPGLLAILIMATLINFLLTPAFSLLPLLIEKHFQREALDLGLLQAIFGIGIVAGGLVLSVWGGFRRRILTTLVGLIGIGLGNLLMGLAPASAFGLAVAGGFVVGFMQPICNGPLLATVQASVAPELQGRVFTVINSLVTAMSPLGLAIAGPVVDALGTQVWFLLGGVACVLMGVGSFFVPAIVHLEAGRDIVVDGTG